MSNKPFGLIRKELQEKIINAVNDSELPLPVVEYIMRDILAMIKDTVNQQENQEIAEYQNNLDSKKEESKNN